MVWSKTVLCKRDGVVGASVLDNLPLKYFLWDIEKRDRVVGGWFIGGFVGCEDRNDFPYLPNVRCVIF